MLSLRNSSTKEGDRHKSFHSRCLIWTPSQMGVDLGLELIQTKEDKDLKPFSLDFIIRLYLHVPMCSIHTSASSFHAPKTQRVPAAVLKGSRDKA